MLQFQFLHFKDSKIIHLKFGLWKRIKLGMLFYFKKFTSEYQNVKLTVWLNIFEEHFRYLLILQSYYGTPIYIWNFNFVFFYLPLFLTFLFSSDRYCFLIFSGQILVTPNSMAFSFELVIFNKWYDFVYIMWNVYYLLVSFWAHQIHSH